MEPLALCQSRGGSPGMSGAIYDHPFLLLPTLAPRPKSLCLPRGLS